MTTRLRPANLKWSVAEPAEALVPQPEPAEAVPVVADPRLLPPCAPAGLVLPVHLGLSIRHRYTTRLRPVPGHTQLQPKTSAGSARSRQPDRPVMHTAG